MSALARSLSLLVPALLTVGCVQVRGSETVDFDGQGVRVVSVRNDRGDVTVSGRASTDIVVRAEVWGRGSSQSAASQRQDDVRWTAAVDQAALVVDGVALGGRRGVDFDIVASEFMDIDAVADSGTVRINDVEGIHVITASNVVGSTIGDLDVYGRNSVDLDFYPYAETDTVIDSDGSVTLALPFGLSYDLTIRGDPNDPMEIAELGWDELFLGEGFVNGRRGRGDIEIDIQATGSVRIVELR